MSVLESFSLTGSDDKRIRGDRAAGNDRQILFITGFLSKRGGNKSKALAQWCQEKGWGFCCYDVRGFGDSEGQFTDYTLSDWIADARTVLESINDGPPVTIVGNSLGSWIAWLVAQEFPIVEQLILIAPAFNKMGERAKTISEERLHDWHTAGWMPWDDDPLHKDWSLSWKWVEESEQYWDKTFDDVRRVKTTILHGLQDTVIVPEGSRRFADGARHPAHARRCDRPLPGQGPRPALGRRGEPAGGARLGRGVRGGFPGGPGPAGERAHARRHRPRRGLRVAAACGRPGLAAAGPPARPPSRRARHRRGRDPGHVRRAPVDQGQTWPTILHTALKPPSWWPFWYPAALRWPGDVWARLPARIRWFRSIVLAACLWGAFVIAPALVVALRGDEYYGRTGKRTVVGRLVRCGCVLDRLVLTDLASVWAVHEDVTAVVEADHEALAAEREVTLLLVAYRTPLGAVTLPRWVNAQAGLQAYECW